MADADGQDLIADPDIDIALAAPRLIYTATEHPEVLESTRPG